MSFPPDNFHETINDRQLANSSEYSFVLYCMNQVHLNVDMSDDCFNPFDFFKDCYKKNKSEKDSLQKYFGIKSSNRPPCEDVSDILDGSTALSIKSEGTDALPYPEMSIFPRILQFSKSNPLLDTRKHIRAYESRFELILEKFNSGKLSHLYANWLKLIESYVELVFRDLTIKWCQWLHSIRAAGRRRSIKASLKTLLPKVCDRFWKNHFLFQHSFNKSIANLTYILSKRASRLKPRDESGTRISFGLWLDSPNGILIFGNGVVLANSGDKRFEAHVTPACGTCLDQVPPHLTIKKLLAFINFAVVRCFMEEIC